MISQTSLVQPPRIAGWLVSLVTSAEQAESIRGDLLEEFSVLAPDSGITCARRWYWRQSVKTATHLIAVGFPVIAGAFVGGWLFLGVLLACTHAAVQEFLSNNGALVYAHINAHVFWLLYAVLIELLIEPFLVGCIVAVAAKGKELFTTAMLSVAFSYDPLLFPAIWFRRLTPPHTMFGLPPALWHVSLIRNFWRMWLTPNLPMTPLLVNALASPLLIIIGGGIVRAIRAARATRPSVSHC